MTEEIRTLISELRDQVRRSREVWPRTSALLTRAIAALEDKIKVPCPQCKERIDSNWVFCPHCGAKP